MTRTGLNFAPDYFPYQKRSSSEKNKKFYEDCVEAGISLITWQDNNFRRTGVRSTKKNKVINFNLFNDIVDKKELENVVNPFKLQGITFPATYRNYPLLNPNVELLLGEEIKRVFNPIIIVHSPDAVTNKIAQKDIEMTKLMLEFLTSDAVTEEEYQEKVQKTEKWANYTYKDKRERMANQVVDYLYKSQSLKAEFSRGFADLLISGEEIYVTDIYGDEPILRKGNPLHFATLRSGDSYKMEDSTIIVEESYLPLGEVIDRYYTDLTSKQIKDLEQGYRTSTHATSVLKGQQLQSEPIDMTSFLESVGGIGAVIEADSIDRSVFSGSFDTEGNILVRRVVWKGMRKIGILSYYDEDGELQKEAVSEHNTPNTELGEEIDWLWINEWHEGTKLGEDIYVRCQPRPVQMRKMDNLSMSHPGIVGTIFNVNNNTGKSLMDFGKPWQYLWNTFMYRTELAFAKSKGKIGKIQSHLVPDGWDMDKWMYYAEVMGWAVEDAFNEGNRGASMGKLAGAMNQSNQVIDLEMGNYIQNHINMLDFIQIRVDEVTGISRQRKGAIDNRETVGGVERAVMQSSHITERWFDVHDNTRLRALGALLETTKVAWKGKKFKKNYVMDDMTIGILDYDDELFAESEYGLYMTNASSDMEMLQALRSLSQVILQNQGSLSIVADLYRTKNPGDLQRKIETHEQEMQKRAEQAQQQEQQMVEQQLQKESEKQHLDRMLEYDKLEREDVNKQLDREKDILIAEIRALGFSKEPDVNQNMIPDVVEQSKLAFEQVKASGDKALKESDIRSKKEIEEKKIKLKKEELESKERMQKQKDKADMERERLKSKTALKNKVSGEK